MRMATVPHCQTCQDKALIQGWQSPKEAPWRYISLLIDSVGHAKVFDDYPKGPDVCLGCVDVVIQRLGSHPPTLIFYDFFFLCSQFFILSIMILHLHHYNLHLKTWLTSYSSTSSPGTWPWSSLQFTMVIFTMVILTTVNRHYCDQSSRWSWSWSKSPDWQSSLTLPLIDVVHHHVAAEPKVSHLRIRTIKMVVIAIW